MLNSFRGRGASGTSATLDRRKYQRTAAGLRARSVAERTRGRESAAGRARPQGAQTPLRGKARV